jgi:hypothetical protein
MMLEGGCIGFKLTFDPPSVVMEGDKMTDTAEGMPWIARASSRAAWHERLRWHSSTKA